MESSLCQRETNLPVGLEPGSFWPRDKHTNPLDHQFPSENLSPWQEVLPEQPLEPIWQQIIYPHILVGSCVRQATSMGLETITALAGVQLRTNTGLSHWLVYNCQSK